MKLKQKYTEIERINNLFICPFCFNTYRALAYHTTQAHNITGKELRQMFGLKSRYQLTTNDIKERHQEIALTNNEGEKLKRVGEKTRYKKGDIGHIKKFWSNQALIELSQRTIKIMKKPKGLNISSTRKKHKHLNTTLTI